jgi:hypothetical protein
MGWVGRSGLIPEFSDTVRGEVSVEGSPPNPEVIDDIPDKRVVYCAAGSGPTRYSEAISCFQRSGIDKLDI